MDIDLDKRSFAVIHAAAKDDTRYALAGVLVSEDGITPASDTRCLFTVTPPGKPKANDKKKPQRKIIDAARLLKQLRRGASKKELTKDDSLRVINIKDDPTDDKKVVITNKSSDTESHVTSEIIDGSFPRFEEIINPLPNQNKHHSFTLSVDVIGTLYQTLKAFHDTPWAHGRNVTLHVSKDSSDPVYVEAESADGHVLRGALMPITDRDT